MPLGLVWWWRDTANPENINNKASRWRYDNSRTLLVYDHWSSGEMGQRPGWHFRRVQLTHTRLGANASDAQKILPRMKWGQTMWWDSDSLVGQPRVSPHRTWKNHGLVKGGIGTPILLITIIGPTGHIMRIGMLSGKRRGSDRILPKTYSFYLYLLPLNLSIL
jgi:hypothetical protein